MDNRYIHVSPTLILPATSANFEFYLYQQDSYVLYSKFGERFSPDHRNRLIDRGVQNIFVPSKYEKEFIHYLRANIKQLLDDEDIPAAVRAEAWSQAASALAKDLFADKLPQAMLKKRYGRYRELVVDSVEYFRQPGALKELHRFISNGYSIYHHGVGTSVLSTCTLLAGPKTDDETLAGCAMGALMHDVGKTQYPIGLLEKSPERLTDEEIQIVRSHPVYGVQVCAPIPMPPEAIHCVLFHHEREDGSGYPSGAKGDQIPYTAKVVALCDRYDSLTRNTGGTPALKPFEALTIIRDDAGSYDPEVFRQLVKVLSAAELT